MDKVPVFLSSLIRARAPMVWGPYWNCFVYYYYSSSPKWIAFLRPKTCSKSHETLHTPQNWRKFTSDIGFRSGCGKMARQRHLYTFNGVRLELRFTYMYENRYTHVTPQYLQKRLLEQNPKPNRKSVIFNFMSKFCVFFAISMRCTLTNSS